MDLAPSAGRVTCAGGAWTLRFRETQNAVTVFAILVLAILGLVLGSSGTASD